MQPGCFHCFESLCMGLKNSRPRRSGGYKGRNENSEVSVTFHMTVTEYDAIHGDAVTCVDTFAPGTCVTGSKDKSVVLFDYKQGIVLRRWIGHSGYVTKVRHSGLAVYSSSRDKTIKAWTANVEGNAPLSTYQGHKLVVTSIDLNQNGTFIFSGSRDNSVKLWDVTNEACVGGTEVSRNLVSCVKWIPGTDTEVAQTGEDKMLRIWDARIMQPAVTFPAQQYFQTCCDCSKDGRYVLTCSNGFNGKGCEATLWDVRAREMVCRYLGHSQTASACIFLPRLERVSPRELIATASHDSTVRIWEREKTNCVATLEFPGSGPLTDLCAWEDGSMCVSTTNTGVYQCLLDAYEGKQQLTRKAHF